MAGMIVRWTQPVASLNRNAPTRVAMNHLGRPEVLTRYRRPKTIDLDNLLHERQPYMLAGKNFGHTVRPLTLVPGIGLRRVELVTMTVVSDFVPAQRIDHVEAPAHVYSLQQP